MSDTPVSPALLSALRRVLAPVVRLMLARGITLQMAVELLKRVFVEVADRDFHLDDGKPSTDSRISLLTGVHRKDVKRLRNLPRLESDLPPKISLGAQVVGAWVTRKRWLDESGHPRPLPRLASAGKGSFEELVASISRDIRPRSVLDEWLRLGVVSVNEQDEVVLNTAAFIPQQDADDKLAYYGHNLGDHAAAATDNVLGGRPPWFERSVHHNGLSPAQVAALRQQASELGTALLQALHASAEDSADADTPAGDRQRFTCGIYFYGAADDSEEASA